MGRQRQRQRQRRLQKRTSTHISDNFHIPSSLISSSSFQSNHIFNNQFDSKLLLLCTILIILSSTTGAIITSPKTIYKYTPPSWTQNLFTNPPPNGKLQIANLPTPIHHLVNPSSPSFFPKNSILEKFHDLNINLYLKRDDMSGGIELGGNKVRTLEFLLADAILQEKNAVVAIGGEQSNHCRATASACRLLGMKPHLILRSGRANEVQKAQEKGCGEGGGSREFGLTGNVLFDRMVGSVIYTCTPGEYGRIGSNNLIQRLCTYLQNEKDQNPYPIPVGGSNGLGTWGYIEGVNEIMNQLSACSSASKDNNEEALALDHVILATGSGGTAAGATLGMALAHGAAAEEKVPKVPKVHAIGVCDNPDYFYKMTSQIAEEMGFIPPSSSTTTTEDFIRHHLIVHQGKGLGYAKSTKEELDFCTQFAIETGIVLDPVYSGKALYHFVNFVLEKEPESFEGRNVLFWHTGGALGMYEKSSDLLDCFVEGGGDSVSPVKRLNVYKKKEDLRDDEVDSLVTI